MSRFALVLIAVLASSTVQAQPISAPKRAGTATALSVVIPGGGQFYSGETVKGGLILVGSGAALATGLSASLAASDQEAYFGCPEPCWEWEPTPLLIGAGVAGVIWLYGVLDAPGSARRANQRKGLAAIELFPVLYVSEGRRQPGLRISTSF